MNVDSVIKLRAMRAELELPASFGVGWGYEKLQMAPALVGGGGFRMAERRNFALDALKQVLAARHGKVKEFQPGHFVLVEVEFADMAELSTIADALNTLVTRFADAPKDLEFHVTEIVPGMLFGQALTPGSRELDAPAMPLAEFMSAFVPTGV